MSPTQKPPCLSLGEEHSGLPPSYFQRRLNPFFDPFLTFEAKKSPLRLQSHSLIFLFGSTKMFWHTPVFYPECLIAKQEVFLLAECIYPICPP
jgi:hypothetical protein